MTECQRCSSERVAEVQAKSSDNNFITLGDKELINDYVPDDMNIGGNNEVEFCYCLDCGQVQGKWPLPLTLLEKGEID